jgi:hypothetical protein
MLKTGDKIPTTIKVYNEKKTIGYFEKIFK